MNSSNTELNKELFVRVDITQLDGTTYQRHILAVITTPLYNLFKPTLWLYTVGDYQGRAEYIYQP